MSSYEKYISATYNQNGVFPEDILCYKNNKIKKSTYVFFDSLIKDFRNFFFKSIFDPIDINIRQQLIVHHNRRTSRPLFLLPRCNLIITTRSLPALGISTWSLSSWRADIWELFVIYFNISKQLENTLHVFFAF